MYTGEWLADKEHGRGKLVKHNGDVFEGSFADGKPDGEIIIHYADKSRFRGMYKKGRREGKAVEETKNGVRFEGSYSNDRRHGDFVEKDRDGKITSRGHYVNGRRFEDK